MQTQSNWQKVDQATRDHITKLIDDGYQGGEVISYDENDECTRGWWNLTEKGIEIELFN